MLYLSPMLEDGIHLAVYTLEAFTPSRGNEQCCRLGVPSTMTIEGDERWTM